MGALIFNAFWDMEVGVPAGSPSREVGVGKAARGKISEAKRARPTPNAIGDRGGGKKEQGS